MNDLELMYLLEDEGYEPSFENLAILKEDMLSEGKLISKELYRAYKNKGVHPDDSESVYNRNYRGVYNKHVIDPKKVFLKVKELKQL